MFRLLANFARRGISWNSFAEIFGPNRSDTSLACGMVPKLMLLRTDSAFNRAAKFTESTQSTTSESDNRKSSAASADFFSGTGGDINDAQPIIVYTDGSCVDKCASGIGIYFGPEHPLNLSKAIRGREHNSGLAEIIAAITALKLLRKWKYYRGQLVILRTDFMPLIFAMNNEGYTGKFHEEYMKLKQLASKFPNGVQFEHIFGHEGEFGNEEANDLARQATAHARLARSVSAPPYCNRSRNSRKSKSSQYRSRQRKRTRHYYSAKYHRSRSAYVPSRHSKHPR